MRLIKTRKDPAGIKKTTLAKGAINSIFDEGVVINGDMSFKGKARVDGRIEGNIKGDYLILSDSSTVIGDIEATVIDCQGRVDGNIKAEKLNVQTGAKINGSLIIADLTVESGTALSGDIKANSSDLRLVQRPLKAEKEKQESTLLTGKQSG